MIRNLAAYASFLILLPPNSFAEEPQLLYDTFCATCHGEDMKGKEALPLIKVDWLYGRDRGQLEKAIRFGISDTDMPALGEFLSEEEIDGLVDLIFAAQDSPPEIARPVPPQIETEDYTLNIETLVAEGFTDEPWGIEFVDERRALITVINGGLRWLIDGKLDPEPIQGLPTVFIREGLLDLALHPDYAENGWIYLTFAHTNQDPKDRESSGMTKVVRGRVKGHQWVDTETIFQVADDITIYNGTRWGSRFFFDKEGYLYFTIGDMGKADQCQDLSRANGKIFRVHADGSIPEDNPFVDVPDALPAIYAYGTRNTQGLAQHPDTGAIWMTDHGPMGGDELNILGKGNNYGWPTITYGVNYDGTTVSDHIDQEGMEQPIIQWTPSIAACPATFVTSPLFPKWTNNLLVGALVHEEIRRIVVHDDHVLSQDVIFKGYGRIRDLKFAPDGALYVLLNRPHEVLRIRPSKDAPE
jgi:glucose/arabinose dehydrogenase